VQNEKLKARLLMWDRLMAQRRRLLRGLLSVTMGLLYLGKESV
jgi:hypothetical protein